MTKVLGAAAHGDKQGKNVVVTHFRTAAVAASVDQAGLAFLCEAFADTVSRFLREVEAR